MKRKLREVMGHGQANMKGSLVSSTLKIRNEVTLVTGQAIYGRLQGAKATKGRKVHNDFVSFCGSNIR